MSTHKLCVFFDYLFGSVNGSYNKIIDGKKYRTAITLKSCRFELWEKSLPVLHSTVFIDPKSQTRVRPPTIKNWEITIRGLVVVHTRFFNLILIFPSLKSSSFCLQV